MRSGTDDVSAHATLFKSVMTDIIFLKKNFSFRLPRFGTNFYLPKGECKLHFFLIKLSVMGHKLRVMLR